MSHFHEVLLANRIQFDQSREHRERVCVYVCVVCMCSLIRIPAGLCMSAHARMCVYARVRYMYVFPDVYARVSTASLRVPSNTPSLTQNEFCIFFNGVNFIEQKKDSGAAVRKTQNLAQRGTLFYIAPYNAAL